MQLEYLSLIGMPALTIVISEFGDNTFFLALILASRQPRLSVFMGVMGATLLTTVFSALLGSAFVLIPFWITCYISGSLFFIFGLSMLKEAYFMRPDKTDHEYQEAEDELKQFAQKKQLVGIFDSIVSSIFSKAFLQAFIITFFGEWGDRSQFATMALAARIDSISVLVGTMLGHAFCAGVSVMAGQLVTQKLSIRFVTSCGGVLFLLFAIISFGVTSDD